MDRIAIRDLRVETHIGASVDERDRLQAVYVTVELLADLSRAGSTDDLADTIDYGFVTSEIAELVRGSRCALLEHLAEKIAMRIAEVTPVSSVSVEVAKESPPVTEDVAAISVRIERGISA